MGLKVIFNIVVVIFTVTNIAALGLETNLRAALVTTGKQKGNRL
jgi:hypothetical protein